MELGTPMEPDRRAVGETFHTPARRALCHRPGTYTPGKLTNACRDTSLLELPSQLPGGRKPGTPLAPLHLEHATLAGYRPRPTATSASRFELLSVLVHLRSLPVLRGIASAIPAHWQRRVKKLAEGVSPITCCSQATAPGAFCTKSHGPACRLAA